ncbi:MAG: 4-hydroxybenzoate octaprenyltransferase [Vicinamibacteria bacterium]
MADDTPRATARTLFQRFDAWERLVRLDKPIGILLLLWPTLTALWIAARGAPPVTLVVIFTLGTVLMRSAGCAFNDWADVRYDSRVERTRHRPLVTGEVTPREALAVAAALAAVAFVLALFTNRATLLLSLAALAIAVAYPFFKRFFALPQAFLGIAFSFGIPMAFAAVRGNVGEIGWLMLLFNLFWVVAYDTEYAMVDRDDDLKIGMRTSAITFGRFDVLAVALCYAAYLAGMVWVGRMVDLGPVYFVGLLVAVGCAAYHLWLIRGRDRDRCFKAFLHNHWLGLAVFAGTVADYAIRAQAWPRSL